MLERVRSSAAEADRASVFGDWTGETRADLTIGERRGLTIIELAAFLHGDEARDALSQALGLTLPGAGASADDGSLSALSIGPGRWLLIGDEAAAANLPVPPESQAAVTDLSHGRAVLSLTGSAAVRILVKGTGIDLDPQPFGEGAVAATALARMPVVIWRRPSGYDLIVPRSYAVSLLDWLILAGRTS
jgi:heterotetrameric sarcosine oxidase gamma subunit